MNQGHHQSHTQHVPVPYQRVRRSPILHRHPVLVPVTLLASSLVLVVASFFADDLFPALNAIGVSSVLLCLSLACVLGICGALAGIIGIIEHVDQWYFQATMFVKTKEQSYANRN
jgi:hypothetical protein